MVMSNLLTKFQDGVAAAQRKLDERPAIMDYAPPMVPAMDSAPGGVSLSSAPPVEPSYSSSAFAEPLPSWDVPPPMPQPEMPVLNQPAPDNGGFFGFLGDVPLPSFGGAPRPGNATIGDVAQGASAAADFAGGLPLPQVGAGMGAPMPSGTTVADTLQPIPEAVSVANYVGERFGDALVQTAGMGTGVAPGLEGVRPSTGQLEQVRPIGEFVGQAFVPTTPLEFAAAPFLGLTPADDAIMGAGRAALRGGRAYLDDAARVGLGAIPEGAVARTVAPPAVFEGGGSPIRAVSPTEGTDIAPLGGGMGKLSREELIAQQKALLGEDAAMWAGPTGADIEAAQQAKSGFYRDTGHVTKRAKALSDLMDAQKADKPLLDQGYRAGLPFMNRNLQDAIAEVDTPNALGIASSRGAKQPVLPGMPKPAKDSWVRSFIEGVSPERLGNEMRQATASLDASNALRQGWGTIRHGPEYFASVKSGARGTFDEAYAMARNAEIKAKNRPGLFIADLPGEGVADLTTREESYAGSLVGNLPGFKETGRANTLFLNEQRARVFDTVANAWARADEAVASGRAGPLQAISSKLSRENDLEALGRYITRTTGRGTLGPAEKTWLSNMLGFGLFSPRYQASRVQGLANMFNWQNPRVAAEAIKDYGTSFAATVALLGLADQSGLADVNLDPTSSDFGKFRIGSTRIDPWAGYQQLATFTARMLSGGYEDGIEPDGTLYKFVRSKLSPLAGRSEDIRRGSDFMGKPVDSGSLFSVDSAVKSFAPMMASSLYEAAQEGLLGEALASVPASFFGLGTNTYKTTTDYKDEVAGELFPGQSYRELTEKQQQQVDADPRVAPRIEQDRKDAAARGDVLAKNTIANAQDRLNASQGPNGATSIDAKLRTGEMTGKEAREAYDQLENTLAIASQTRANSPEAKDAIAEIEKNRKDMTPAQKAQADYFAIFDMPGVKDGQGNLNFDAYRKALESWQANYPDYSKEDVSPTKVLSPGHAELKDARKQLAPYFQIEDQAWKSAQASDPDLMQYPNADAYVRAETLALVAEGLPRPIAEKIASAEVSAATADAKIEKTLYLLDHPEHIALLRKWGYSYPSSLNALDDTYIDELVGAGR